MIPFTYLLVALNLALPSASEDDSPRWLRGNTHTHTLWSDGDAPPETVVAWYVDNGYQFLVLSDHNVMQSGERWFDVQADGRLTPEKVEAVRARFGDDWLRMRTTEGTDSMRLRTLEELRSRFERPGEFVLVPGEEVTSSHRMSQIHINAINVEEALPPLRTNSVQDTIQDTLDAITDWGRGNDRPVLGHVNHPNFQNSLASSNLAGIEGLGFFEVYNGHRSVQNERVGDRPSTEEMWDLALAARLSDPEGGDMLYGIASDDAHDHYAPDAVSIPGRGWIMVRSESLDPDDLVRAMRKGAFYATTGVELKDVLVESDTLTIDIDARPGTTYETFFIKGIPIEGSVRIDSERSTEDPAVYRFRGDELYVRAVIRSSRLHPRPYRNGDLETAWTQPVRPPAHLRPGSDPK